MINKLTIILLSIILIGTATQPALAQTTPDPKVLFEVDCDPGEKKLKIGFVTNPDDPDNGTDLVAAKFTLVVEPEGTTTLDDLKDAELSLNSAYSNVLVPSNDKNTVGNTLEFKIVLGFVPPNVLHNVPDLLFLRNTNQKKFKISVTAGEMIPQGDTNSIFVATPVQTFSADPDSCTAGDTTTATQDENNVNIDNFSFLPAEITIEVGESVTWENIEDPDDNIKHTVTSVGAGGLNSGTLESGEKYTKQFTEEGTFQYQCTIHPSMKGKIIVTKAADTSGDTTPSSDTTTDTTTADEDETETSIEIKSDVEKAKADAPVVVTANIKNRNQKPINWSQTCGKQIKPDIKNAEIGTPENQETESVFSFTMPTDQRNICLRLTVGTTTKTITIEAEKEEVETKPAADTTTAAPDTTSTTTTDKTLEERLEERRREQQENAARAAEDAQPGNLYGAAGSLAESGPSETFLILLLSGMLLFVWKIAGKRQTR